MATWYIASTSHPTTPGNDTTGTGSSGSPWATISKAHTSAASGDTIIVKAGGSIVWASQTFTKSLTIQGESVPVYNPVTKAWTGAIFDGAAGVVTWQTSSNASLTVSRLIFTNAASGGTVNINSSNLSPGPYFHVPPSGVFTMSACILYNVGWTTFVSGRLGALIAPLPNSVANIINSIFYAPTSVVAALIANNGISGPISAATVTMSNCILYGASALLGRFDAGGTWTFTLRNNIFVNTAASAVLITNTPSGTTYNNNVAFGTWTSIPSGSNNLTSDPQFVDPANGDFRLRPGSPAINAGVAL